MPARPWPVSSGDLERGPCHDGAMESTSPEPGDPEFVVDRWLHPSMYTAVPDPAWPTGYEQRVQQQVQAQWAVIREAEAVAPSSRDKASAAKAALPPADPSWPHRVQDAWESYRQARITADRLIDATGRLPAPSPGERAADDAWWHANIADHDAEEAYEQFCGAWDAWQHGPEISAEHDEPEAGS